MGKTYRQKALSGALGALWQGVWRFCPMEKARMERSAMRRFWFVFSLVLVFVFTASASYIYFALAGSGAGADKPYQVAGTPVVNMEVAVKTVSPQAQLSFSELYTLCGHAVESEFSAAECGLVGVSFDELALQGWAVAQTGEHTLALSRQRDELCPQEAGQRLVQRTERGLAVFEGTRQHKGRLLLEMPIQADEAELPPDFLASLAEGGYQLASQAELDELLESLDELLVN